MIYLQFVAGLVFSTIGALSSYHATLKLTHWYYPLNLLVAVLANIIWFSMAKSETNANVLMFKALIWDTIIVMTYVIVPLLFFNARFTFAQGIGILLTVVGLIITKLG